MVEWIPVFSDTPDSLVLELLELLTSWIGCDLFWSSSFPRWN